MPRVGETARPLTSDELRALIYLFDDSTAASWPSASTPHSAGLEDTREVDSFLEVDNLLQPAPAGHVRVTLESFLRLVKQLQASALTDHVLALVFSSTSDIWRVQKAAYMHFLTENALDPTTFPSLLKFKTETISMVASHLNGPDTTVGSFTFGGSESCLLSMIVTNGKGAGRNTYKLG
ncbi:Sphingosine-1-phosphate lyase [Diplonema papillatum]|nr:Sphingosine-1-phosphate lyase [Diplonema papillatum]